ncbi:NXPE family member 3-like [Poecilia formosa]|uniref:NXPE family member 3-like n=1 Tax=Poecilia formosa TaxID=48698 RepID=UPI000443B66B|nr:PREDICTED: NXPE family member 3-like [Poecilia formosa]XP_007540193.1 PREDICTED: NXPE family member 3-like [Poecilia formosa]XP_016520345.1 PREDICTED: NXPE family member 3-like [Poecilia formosa]
MMRPRARRAICCLKFRVIYLLLTLNVIILLLYGDNYLRTREVTKVKSTTSIAKTSCSFHSLSPKEAQVANFLKHSIAWPETLSLPPHLFLNDTSDPAQSTFTILPHERGSWFIGDQLEVLIKVSDFYGRPKTSGGDFLLARLHNPTLNAGVAGRVFDHRNGSYTAVFSLLWEGSAHVEVTLVHPSEGITVLEKLTREQPDRIYFRSFFRLGSVYKITNCNICLNSSRRLCNYTDPSTGEPWFCYKPKNLSCDARITHAKGGLRVYLRPMEEKLFQSGVNLKVSIPASGPAHIQVLSQFDYFYRSDFNFPWVFPGVTKKTMQSSPSGYYYQGAWRSLDGTTVHQFNTITAISQCLKNKAVHLYGDSTIRQWFEYLNQSLPDLKEFDLHSSNQTGPFLALDYANNILLTFRSHGPPIRFRVIPVSHLHYIANELDRVVGGANTVVVIGIWSHFSTFPIEVYIRRLLNIRKAVVRLLSRSPDTLVIIRTANPKALTLYETLTNSDWFSLQRDEVLRAIFKRVRVKLVDAWEMSVAHHLPHSLHPQPPIVKNMIDVVLSYICPKTENL